MSLQRRHSPAPAPTCESKLRALADEIDRESRDKREAAYLEERKTSKGGQTGRTKAKIRVTLLAHHAERRAERSAREVEARRLVVEAREKVLAQWAVWREEEART